MVVPEYAAVLRKRVQTIHVSLMGRGRKTRRIYASHFNLMIIMHLLMLHHL